MTEQERGRLAEREIPADEAPAAQEAEPAALQNKEPEEQTEPTAAEKPAKQKNGLSAPVTFWLLVLYDLPGVGLIASALIGFIFAKTRAHRSLARACFVRGVILLAAAGGLVAAYVFLHDRYALRNFFERLLQSALDFVRSNSDKL